MPLRFSNHVPQPHWAMDLRVRLATPDQASDAPVQVVSALTGEVPLCP